MNNQKGFTLIELVVVIVILGILSAVAVPKFVDMQEEAKQASIEGARGAVKSAVALVHARWLVDDGATEGTDDDGNTTYTVSLEGTNISVTEKGYPTADAGGIMAAAGIDSDFTITSSDEVARNQDIESSAVSTGAKYFTYEVDADGYPTVGNVTTKQE